MRKKFTSLNVLLISICALTWAACSNSNEEQNDELSSNSEPAPVEEASQGIEFFQGSYDDALAQAQLEDKHMFVFIDVPSGFNSDVMLETVLPLPEVGEYFNERFISFRIDLRASNNVPSTNKLPFVNVNAGGHEFLFVEYPTYVILDSNEDELGLVQGRLSSKQLISVIDRVIGESESKFDELQERYDSGDRSPHFVQQYLMEVIEEIAIVRRDGELRSNTSFREDVAKYKENADAYFASKPTTDLINETDAHLIMYFNEPPVRGNELVELVLQHYNEFLAVSSEIEMAQFTLHATTNAIQVAALVGDETFVEYVEALETYPLRQAVDYERTRTNWSHHFPEYIRSHWGVDYHKARGEWDQVYEILVAVLEEQKKERVWPEYWSYSTVAAELMQSTNPVHLETAVEYGKTLHESNDLDPNYAAVYVAALQASGKKYSAVQVSEQYSKRLSRSGRGMQRHMYEKSLSSLLERIDNTASSED